MCRNLAIVLASFLCLQLSVGQAGDPPALADAALRAVQMVDAHEGWAVGDDGLILHTIDGGKTWERQASGTQGSLRALQFLDPFHGFVVGREEGNFGLDSWGILLYTEDGGVKWQRIAYRETPGLFGIRFVNPQVGFLLAESSATQPSGLYQTDNGGRSWTLITGERVPSVLAATFRDAEHGLLAGQAGLRNFNRGQLVAQPEPLLAGRTVRAIQQVGSTVILAGERGLLLRSSNGGVTWQPALEQIPPHMARSWDFNAIAMQGDRIWVTGRPGSIVLHSWDAGKTWQIQPTGQTMPLLGLHFLDEQRGVAVGALGTVLVTTDAGRNWTVQRRGGHRSAALLFSAKGQQLPLGTLALQGGDEGYLFTAIQVGHTPWQQQTGTHEEARFNEGVRKAYATYGEVLTNFPLPAYMEESDTATIVKSWALTQPKAEGNPEEQGLAWLEEQFVLALRMWRPDVVITDAPDTQTSTGPVGGLIAFVAKRACERAGRADAYPEHFAKFDLKPWSPKKLYGRCDQTQEQRIVHDLENCRPLLLASANEATAVARSILQSQYDMPLEQEGFKLIWSSLEDADQHTALMQGLQLERGGQARRLGEEFDQDQFENATKMSSEMHDLFQKLRKLSTNPLTSMSLMQGLDATLANLDEERAGEALFALGQQFNALGQWPQAKEIYIMLLDRYPAHRLALEATRWLAIYSSSSMAKRRDESKQFSPPIVYDFRSPPKPTKRNLPTDPTKLDVKDLGIKRPPETVLQKRKDELRIWYKGGLCFGDVLAAFGPTALGDPRVQFSLQAAHRRLNDVAASHLWNTQFILNQTQGPWMEAALAELWLVKPQGECPKPLLSAILAPKPPYLDGKLDDACWQLVKPIKLKDSQGTTANEYSTEARFAYDAKFLYLAVECKQPANRPVVPPMQERQRDDQVRGMDRISLLLDVDRNYASYCQIQIDQRGCVREDCWGDLSWNPQCYVAVVSTESGWVAEVAIPMQELTSAAKLSEIWAANLVRIIPGKGVQAVHGPANVQPRPEGMTLLQFIEKPPEPKR